MPLPVFGNIQFIENGFLHVFVQMNIVQVVGRLRVRDQHGEDWLGQQTAVARVRLFENAKFSILVNGKIHKEYFKTLKQYATAESAASVAHTASHFEVTAHIRGGGLVAQAEALRHGMARALVKYDAEGTRGALKQEGYLKRDPRVKERRKFGLKKARRAPQWSKR